jgi:hypothetical protein
VLIAANALQKSDSENSRREQPKELAHRRECAPVKSNSANRPSFRNPRMFNFEQFAKYVDQHRGLPPSQRSVHLSDGTIRMSPPGGKTQDMKGKIGEALYTPAGVHNPENIGGTPFDAVLIELKGAKAVSKPASPKE